MPIAVACPACGAKITAPDAAAGRRAKCPRCQGPVTVPAPAADPGFEVLDDDSPAAPPAPPAKPKARVAVAVAVADDEDDAPPPKPKGRVAVTDDDAPPESRSPADDEDDEDDRPRPKKSKKGGKGKPKAGGIPTWALAAAGGVFLLFVLAGGGVAIWLMTGPPPPDKVMADAGWYKADEKDGWVTAYFPGRPAKYERTGFRPPDFLAEKAKMKADDLAWSMQTWTRRDAGRDYYVMFFSLPAAGAKPGVAEEAIARTRIPAGPGVEVLVEDDISVGGYRGRRIVTRGGGESRVAYVLGVDGHRLLVASVGGPGTFDQTDPKVAAFFGNLAIQGKSSPAPEAPAGGPAAAGGGPGTGPGPDPNVLATGPAPDPNAPPDWKPFRVPGTPLTIDAPAVPRRVALDFRDSFIDQKTATQWEVVNGQKKYLVQVVKETEFFEAGNMVSIDSKFGGWYQLMSTGVVGTYGGADVAGVYARRYIMRRDQGPPTVALRAAAADRRVYFLSVWSLAGPLDPSDPDMARFFRSAKGLGPGLQPPATWKEFRYGSNTFTVEVPFGDPKAQPTFSGARDCQVTGSYRAEYLETEFLIYQATWLDPADRPELRDQRLRELLAIVARDYPGAKEVGRTPAVLGGKPCQQLSLEGRAGGLVARVAVDGKHGYILAVTGPGPVPADGPTVGRFFESLKFL